MIRHSRTIPYFALFLTLEILLLVLHWPGIIQLDLFLLLDTVAKKGLSFWYSYPYSAIVYLQQISGVGVWSIALLNKTICSVGLLLFLLGARNLANTSNLKLCLLVLTLSLWPNFLVNRLLIDRDTFYSSLQFLLVGYIIFRLHNKTTTPRALIIESIGLGLIVSILAAVRQDGIITSILAIFTFWKLGLFKLIRTQWFLISALGVLLTSHFILPPIFTAESERTKYALTGVLRPTLIIINKSGIEYLSEGDKAYIHKVLDIEKIKNDSKIEIFGPFEKNQVIVSEILNDKSKFFLTTLKVWAINYRLFFKILFHAALDHLAISKNQVGYSDALDFVMDTHPHYKNISERNGIKRTGSLELMVTFWKGLIESASESFIGRFFLNFYIGLFTLPLLFIFSRSHVEIKWLTLLVWIRFPIVFLMSPGAQCKYFFSFSSCSVLLLFYVWCSGYFGKGLER